MLKERILTAVVGLPILLYALLVGPTWIMQTLFVGFVALSTYETSNLIFFKMENVFASADAHTSLATSRIALALCLCANLLIFLVASSPVAEIVKFNLVITVVLIMFLLGIFFSSTIQKGVARAVAYTISVCYGCFPWLIIWQLYAAAANGRYLLLLLGIVWGGDTFAYFGGRFFGKHKLAPQISPKKTVEGAIFGILGSALIAVLVSSFFTPKMGSFVVIFIVSCVGGFFAQLGDLVESALKRFTGVKDSGKIFPGHGGFLDRIDGLLFSAPIVWMMLYLFTDGMN